MGIRQGQQKSRVIDKLDRWIIAEKDDRIDMWFAMDWPDNDTNRARVYRFDECPLRCVIVAGHGSAPTKRDYCSIDLSIPVICSEQVFNG